MCLKVGGWARVYDAYGVNGNSTNGALATGQNSTRSTQNLAPKVRGYITLDARNQTEYGTVRSYIAVGYNSGGPQSGIGSGNVTAPGTNTALSPYDNAVGFSANRAFIQFAGFTFGVTTSFYDFYSQPATSFFGGMINPASDTGDAGDFVFGAYTAMLGGGLSATLSAENPRTTAVINGGATSMFTFATGSATAGNLGIQPASSAEANQWPDIVANLRVDQTWGSAQIMGAIHDVAATYYTSSDLSGSPSDTIGWAVGAGINGVFGATGTSIELTTAWGVNVAYEHFWNPHWQTSVYGAYTATSYDAAANGYMCHIETLGAFSLNGATCNNNFQTVTIGTRTQFNLDSQTYLGVDIVYQELQTGLSGMQANYGNGAEAAGPRTVSNQSALMGEFRVHRNFYP
jgi:hypothetical protein